uniref:Uncharacterized protein n=1 Tax=Vespula pensylvanica TaxID=30213 RepID=A0A834PCK1_VESPE|nr:hypothetical protein H0235_003250 [Vespula pensylvanica]
MEYELQYNTNLTDSELCKFFVINFLVTSTSRKIFLRIFMDGHIIYIFIHTCIYNIQKRREDLYIVIKKIYIQIRIYIYIFIFL